jgi:hypothetical protein
MGKGYYIAERGIIVTSGNPESFARGLFALIKRRGIQERAWT